MDILTILALTHLEPAYLAIALGASPVALVTMALDADLQRDRA